MQQLPMAFINIALGGKNAALNSLGKSLSNDDFGQILGSVQDGEDWLRQSLVDHLDPEQLAELERQLAGGMSLPEAASIYLQQQRQAADLPPVPIENMPDGETTPGGRARRQTGLPWPLSQYLSVTPEPAESAPSAVPPPGPAAEEAAPVAPLVVPVAPIAAAEVPAGEASPGLRPSPAESLTSAAASASRVPPHLETGPTQPGKVTARFVVEAASSSPPISSKVLESPPGPGSYRTVEDAPQDTLPAPRPGAVRIPMETIPPTSPTVSRPVSPAMAPVPPDPIVNPRAVGRTPGSPVVPAAETGETVLPTAAPLVSTLRALWRQNEPSLLNVARSAVEVAPPPGSAGPAPVVSAAAVAPHTAPLPELPFGFLAREGQSAPNPQPAAHPRGGIAGANPLAELVADLLPNPSAARSEFSGPADRLVMNVLGVATGTEAAGAGVSRTAAAPVSVLAVPQRLHEAGWSQALGERLVLMAGREQQTAEIKLNPAHLGPLEVKLSLQQDQASVSFLSQHAPVREALEQAIPRLREMFNQQDLQLVNVDVGQRREQAHGGDGTGRGHGRESSHNRPVADSESALVIDVPISTRGEDSDRRLDLYA